MAIGTTETCKPPWFFDHPWPPHFLSFRRSCYSLYLVNCATYTIPLPEGIRPPDPTRFGRFVTFVPFPWSNRRLRRVSLPVIFKMTRCTSSERFARLTAECTVNPQFAGLIRHLDVVDIDTRLLTRLLPFLTSLVRLDLKPDALDTHLLVVVSSHPTIVTVAIRVALLPQLNALVTMTDLPFSKILVSQPS
ncbi:hypothetical protein B0H14DRAFT_126893 [Mycena olivaceomarginata]|nr:hypothetical protein B0H14DRAFT_126893 [Mycena olivaceomarginata]